MRLFNWLKSFRNRSTRRGNQRSGTSLATRAASWIVAPNSPARSPEFSEMVERLEDRTVLAAAFALSGSNLISFDTATPTQVASTPIVGVDASETLVGIDVRPQNGVLYGLGVNATTDTATFYAISTRTGQAAVVGTVGQVAFTTDGTTVVDLPDPATVGYGVDFNPVVDRFRVVAGSLNFRVNPNTGAPVDGNTGVAGTNTDGAINGGTTTVDATAYTNNQPNSTATTQYTLDAASDMLFIQNPPNNGTQTSGSTVMLGGSTLDFSAVNGFDIPSGVNVATSNDPVTDGSGFAALTVGGVTSLYSIVLGGGAGAGVATNLGTIGTGTDAISGLSIRNDLGGFPAIGLNAAGTGLVRFNTASVGTSTSVTLGALTAGETLVAIDFRPQTGQLYGLGVNAVTDTATLYLIDPQTGAVSVVGTASQIAFVDAGGATVDLPSAASGYGFDFNPTVDRVRVTTSTGLNFRINPSTGAPVDGNLNSGTPAGINTDGAINGNSSTGVSATAYTNSFGQPLTGGVTTQYTLDAASNSLFIQNPPNSGSQTTPRGVTLNGAPLDFTNINGFDIPAAVRVTASHTVAIGSGIAVLEVDGVSKIYKIDLTSGAATEIGPTTVALSGLTLGDVAKLDVVVNAGAADTVADTYMLSVNGTDLEIFINGVLASSTPLSAIGSLTINGSSDDDTLTVALGAGDAIPDGGLTFIGGAGGSDSLNITSGTQGAVTYNYTNANDGSVVMANFGTISYTGLEPVTNTGTATDIVFNLPGTTDATITLADLVAGTSARLQSTVPTFETTDFAIPVAGGSITINLGANDQTIAVGDLTLNASTGLTINGDGGTDAINLNGTTTGIGNLTLSAETIADGAAANTTAAGNASFTGTTITIGEGGGDSFNAGTLTFNSSSGAVVISEDSGTNIVGVNTALSLDLDSTGAITDATATSVAVTNLADVNGTSISLGGGTFNAGTLTFNSMGAVVISEDSGTNIVGVNTALSLDLDSTGAITDATATSVAVTNLADVNGTSISLGGGTFNAGTLTFNSAGAVVISEDSSMTVGGASTAGGLTLVSTDDVTLNATVNVTGNTSITAGTTTGGIDVNAKLTSSGTILLDAADEITINAAIDPTTVTLQADDDIILNATVDATTSITVSAGQDGSGAINGSGLLTAPTIDLNAASGIGNMMALELAATSISADTTTGAIDLDNANAATATFTSLTTSTGTITVDNSGGGAAIFTTATTTTSGDIDLENTAGDLTVGTAVTAGGVSNVVLTTTTSGNVILTGTTTAAGDDVTVTSAGNISGAGLITSNDLFLTADGTIGTALVSINTSVTNLTTNSSTANGDQFIDETNSLNVTSVNAGTGTLTITGGVFDLLGDTVANASSITVATGGTLDVNSVRDEVTNLTIQMGGTLRIEINGEGGSGDANGNGQVIVTGTVDVTNGTLVVAYPGLVAAEVTPGREFVVIDNNPTIDNEDVNPVIGMFNGIDEADQISADPGVVAGTDEDSFLTYGGGVGGNNVLIVFAQANPTINLGTGVNAVGTNIGAADNFLIRRDNTTIQILNANTQAILYTALVEFLQTMVIVGENGQDDNFEMSFLTGNPLDSNAGTIELTFRGGTGGRDRLDLTDVDSGVPMGTGWLTHTYTYQNANDGRIDLLEDAAAGGESYRINYVGFEPLTNDGTPVNLVFDLPNTNDTNARLLDIDQDGIGGLNDGFLRLIGSTFEMTDFLIADAATLTINGNAGNDQITVQSLDAAFAGTMFLNGGAGKDVLNASLSTRPVFLRGEAGNDTLLGGTQADTLTGGVGNDSLNGGAEIDTVVETTVVPTMVLTNFSLTGNGTDRLASVERAVLTGTAASNLMDASAFTFGNVTLLGGEGNDTLLGSAFTGAEDDDGFNDSLDGGAGFDVARQFSTNNQSIAVGGAPGTHVVRGASSDAGDLWNLIEGLNFIGNGTVGRTLDASAFTGGATLIGGSGNDTLIGGSGNNVLNGSAGADSITGGGTSDTLLGGAGNDTLVGNDGNDSLNGQAGNDTLRGNAGDDRLVGDAGNDKIFGGSGQDAIDGGLGNDTLTGEDGHDTINGGGGGDAISGGDGDDVLDGGVDNDTVIGGFGNDVLRSGGGSDRLDGGSGNDRFTATRSRITLGGGNDTVSGSGNVIDAVFVFDFEKLLV
ncbi:MAG: DUF4394 domain-containing protein [Planctomycetaceae bacterium]